jgi:Cell division septal protein
MALGMQRGTARAGRRISLTRSGSSGAKNLRKEAPVFRKTERRPIPFGLWFSRAGRALATLFLFATLLMLVAGMSFGLLYGYRYFTTTQYFSLKTVQINGNTRLSSEEILEILQINDSSNTLNLSIKTVEEKFSRNPWVRRASITRVMPDTLVISIEERVPAFWVLNGGQLHYADAQGAGIAPVEAGQFSSLPTLEIEKGAEEARHALPDLVQSLRESQIPLDMSSISWVRLSAARGVELYVEGSSLIITIGLEDWLSNLGRLGQTVADLKARGEISSVRSIRAQGHNVWVEKSAPAA